MSSDELRKFLERRAVVTMASARTAPTAFGASRAGVAKEAGEVRALVVEIEADDKASGEVRALVGKEHEEWDLLYKLILEKVKMKVGSSYVPSS